MISNLSNTGNDFLHQKSILRELGQINSSLFLVQTKGANISGSPSEYVGTVVRRAGRDLIKVARYDSAEFEHYLVPFDWVDKVDSEVVFLNRTEEEFLNTATIVTLGGATQR